MRWGERTSGELAGRRHVVLVPLGSVEQHGPHLPLDTDARIAVAVAEGAARQVGRPVLVAPAVAYGASGEHQGFAGTLSIGTDALALVLVELARSAGPEVARLILVNGHGGNLDALARAEATLTHEGRRVDVWSPRLEGADTHAGRTETSLLLAIAPEVVRLELAERGNTEPLAGLLPALRAGGIAAVSPNGVLGDPVGASAAEGERLLAAMVDDLVALIGDNPTMEVEP